MSHTPGPWSALLVGDTGGENPTDVYEIITERARIAEFVADRDASLIAAAPELLEAAHKAQDGIRAALKHAQMPDLLRMKLDAYLVSISAAIAKAEGK